MTTPNIHLAYDVDWDTFSSAFVHYIEEGLSPSASLRKLESAETKYAVNPENIISLLMKAYPGLMPQGMHDWLYENHFPERTDLLSDEEFDSEIAKKVKGLADQ
jgi:alpha-amylase/alpha-mannosidase (GH57 family)